MARDLIVEFLLPLVKGGRLRVGRPLSRAAVEALGAEWIQVRAGDTRSGAPASSRPDAGSDSPPRATGRATVELAEWRRRVAATLIPEARPPSLDEPTIRLAAAVHNLLALSHPDLDGRGLERRQARIAKAALELASIGSPSTEAEAVNRHSLLARLPEITRTDHTVRFWAGNYAFVGRQPPRRLVAWPRLRGVRVDTVRRTWLREIGVPAVARPALLALDLASPLGEALDPLRLDPPPSWGRILPVLRFPRLCRIVAGRVVEQGLDAAGGALASALFRFASRQEPVMGQPPTPDAVAFALRFLAHSAWLQLLFPVAAEAPRMIDGSSSHELAALLVAAGMVSPTLIWPPDISRDGDVGRAFAARLDVLTNRVRAQSPDRLAAALALCRFAAPDGAANGILSLGLD